MLENIYGMKRETIFMETNKIKKINIPYLLGYIFVPILVCALCFLLSYLFFPKGNMAVVLLMLPPFLALMWWIFGGKLIFKKNQKELEKELDQMGFVRNHTFYGRGSMVVVDAQNGKIALLFFWNPTQKYVLPASRLKQAWVDDGEKGRGFMAGSSCVSFLMNIDGVTIRVYTFTSNQRWAMNSDYILKGIAKADMMAKILMEAKNRA